MHTDNAAGAGEEVVETSNIARVESLSKLVVAEGHERLDLERVEDLEGAGSVLIGRIKARKARLLLHHSAELGILDSLRLYQAR